MYNKRNLHEQHGSGGVLDTDIDDHWADLKQSQLIQDTQMDTVELAVLG